MRFFILISVMVMAGCGDQRYAPVSGRVTLDGKPVSHVTVQFQPVGSKRNVNPGRGSSAVTDADGTFALRVNTQQAGAVIGEHEVRLTTVLKRDSSQSPWADDIIPPKYKAEGALKYEVPRGGTDQANFDLVSR